MSHAAYVGSEPRKLDVPAPPELIGVDTPDPRPLCRPAASSFSAGLVALRMCWLPGVNVILGAASLILGVFALWQIARSRGAMSGIDEAISGVVLGIVVLGLSVFFLSVLIAAYGG
jgi:hypothetical protein